MIQIMKTGLLAISGLFLVLAGNAQSIAAPAEKDNSKLVVNVYPLADKSKLRVLVLNPARKRVDLTIRNKKGEVVFQENTNIESFGRDLNFTQMESDNYTVEIKSKNYLYEHQLALKDRVIEKRVDLIPGTEVAIMTGK
jgi:hypothetical protein